MRHHLHRVAFALSITACIASGLVAARAETGRDAAEGPAARAAAEANEPVYRQVGRELARLDERLDLHTFPDGSPLWPPRLAAAIERRIESQTTNAGAVPSRGLLRRLGADLRALGADGPLGGPPELQPAKAGSARGKSWRERLDSLLVTARLLNRKLDTAEARQAGRAPAAEDDRLAARSAPANDTCGAAGSIGPGTFTGNTLGATNDGSATCGSSASSSDVWYRYTAIEDGNVSFDTFDSSFDTVLSLHSGCLPMGAELGCSDDADGTTRSALDLDMTAGEEVWVRIAGFGGAAGDYTLHVAETGGLSGTVTRKDTGAPISGARVRVARTYGYSVTSALTGADGTYLVSGLTPDTYVSGASSAGFITQNYDGVECPRFSGCTGEATPITVGPSVTEGIDFSLTPAGSISGTVTDRGTAAPLQGYAYLYAAPGGAYLDSASIDSDGNYTLDASEAGSYYVAVDANYYRSELYDDVPCASCDVTTGTQIPVASGASVTGIDFALDQLGTVEGTVVDQSTSEPIPYQELVLSTPQGLSRRVAYTDSDGSYELRAVLPGTYVVRVLATIYLDELYDDVPCEGGCSYSSGTPVSVSLGATTSGIDFGLVQLGRISGTVTEAGSGTPLGGSSVVLYDSRGSYRSSSNSQADGTYTSPYLASGTYFAIAYSDGHQRELYDGIPCPGGCAPTSGTPITVTADSTTPGVDFHLVAGGRISGTVTNATSGLPVAGLRVRFYNPSGYSVGGASTASDGTYRSPELVIGTYYVATNASSGYQNEVYDGLPCSGTCDPTAGTPVSVTLTATTSGVDLSVVPWGGIQGTLTAADTGEPLDRCTVYLYDASGEQVGYKSSISGAFAFAMLAPGSYYLKAVNHEYLDHHEDTAYPDLPCEPSCDLSQATPLEVPLGTTLAGVNFVLPYCPLDAFVDLHLQDLAGVYTAEACEQVSADWTTVQTGADVTFRSGREVVLGNGFAVESGASFRVVIDPDVFEP